MTERRVRRIMMKRPSATGEPADSEGTKVKSSHFLEVFVSLLIKMSSRLSSYSFYWSSDSLCKDKLSNVKIFVLV